MKPYLLILASFFLVGCAASQPQQAKRDVIEDRQYESATAYALAFDAPIAAAYPLPGLDREAREPGAFIGYQDGETETYTIGMDNYQSNDPFLDIFVRYGSSEKTGTRYR